MLRIAFIFLYNQLSDRILRSIMHLELSQIKAPHSTHETKEETNQTAIYVEIVNGK